VHCIADALQIVKLALTAANAQAEFLLAFLQTLPIFSGQLLA
jgi:hypothetical protein